MNRITQRGNVKAQVGCVAYVKYTINFWVCGDFE